MRTRIDRYTKNTRGRDLIVADVHGCFSKLERALAAVDFCDDDRLFMLGDLIDRGPESHLTLDFMRRHPNARTIEGNHERSLVRMIDNEKSPLEHIVGYGGGWIARLGLDHDLPFEVLNEFAEFFRALPVAIELETDAGLLALVHAACPYATWGQFSQAAATGMLRYDDAISSRQWANDPAPQFVDGVRAVLVGHDPSPDRCIRVKGNVHYLDTYAWHRGGECENQFALVDASTLATMGHVIETKQLDWSEE